MQAQQGIIFHLYLSAATKQWAACLNMFPFGKYNSTRTCNERSTRSRMKKQTGTGHAWIILHSFCRILVICLANVMIFYFLFYIFIFIFYIFNHNENIYLDSSKGHDCYLLCEERQKEPSSALISSLVVSQQVSGSTAFKLPIFDYVFNKIV